MEELVIRRRKIVARQIPFELINKRDIILHFRDLANIGDMLEGGSKELISQYRKRLHSVGWSYKNIHLLEEIAYAKTNWEELLPHIHSKGNIDAWKEGKHRWVR